MTPTLIVPLDGSAESIHALSWTRAAARTLDGRLVLLRAVQHGRFAVRSTNAGPVLLQLEDVARGLREEGIPVETQVRWDDPVRAIVGAMRECGGSVIVRFSYEQHDFAGWRRATIITR